MARTLARTLARTAARTARRAAGTLEKATFRASWAALATSPFTALIDPAAATTLIVAAVALALTGFLVGVLTPPRRKPSPRPRSDTTHHVHRPPQIMRQGVTGTTPGA
jgi:hypothetical protein